MKNIEVSFKEVFSYIEQYENKVSETNAKDVINAFKAEWEKVIGYMPDNKDMGEEYGKTLLIYSAGVYEFNDTSEKDIKKLADKIETYDNNKNVKFNFEIKEALYLNLGLCWNKIGKVYNSYALAAFKKYIYYLITRSSNMSYQPIAYVFRPCSKFLFEALINESLNLSSPSRFNDPFDCPILELLNNDDEISHLIRQAYNECLKIGCFSSNTKLPIWDGKSIITGKKGEQQEGQPEYLNELMWAHYADSHRGICIKYHFPNSLSKLGDETHNIVAYFKDVIYDNKDISKYSTQNTISLYDAFFLKGKQWSYENELRYLYFNLNGKEGYESIKIENCIEAVYFGVKCSKEDKDTIMNILRDKRYVKTDMNKKTREEFEIELYNMIIDKEHFGQIKSVKIETKP